MKKLLLASVFSLALASGANAVQVNLPSNPTSATGNFQLAPGAGAFEDQVTFGLNGGPVFLTIANATNTFAGPGDAIVNWVASIYSAGADQILDNADANPLNDDDVLLFGPQAATACLLVTNCQSVGGSGIINGAGIYYAEFTGIGCRHQRIQREHLDVRCAGSSSWFVAARNGSCVRPARLQLSP